MSRQGLVVGLAFLLVLPAAANGHIKTFGGVIPDVPTGGHVHRVPLARAAGDLPYGGGPVLHSNRTHVIFWAPAGSGLGYDPGYQSMVERFLANVAADSRMPTNVYGLSGQYHDGGGPAAYASTYAGAVTTTDPLPLNGCSEPPGPPLGTGPGWGVCLQDSQLAAEVAHVVSVDHLPSAGNDIYFLVTPNGMGSCEGVRPPGCALGGSDDPQSYCGYHSSDPEGTLPYAVIPYNAVTGHCQSGNPRPNASTADPAISTISHEHNEVVTDPLGNAWIDGAGSENGDRCIASYGPPLGGSGTTVFNQLIHAVRYYLQNEYSNQDHSCQARDEAGAVAMRAPSRVVAGRSFAVSARARDPDGSITHYDWFFGHGHPGRHRTVSHTYPRAGSYRIVLRVTDSDGNWAYQAAPIKVAKAAKAPARRRR